MLEVLYNYINLLKILKNITKKVIFINNDREVT
jgi:hypothetical protein